MEIKTEHFIRHTLIGLHETDSELADMYCTDFRVHVTRSGPYTPNFPKCDPDRFMIIGETSVEEENKILRWNHRHTEDRLREVLQEMYDEFRFTEASSNSWGIILKAEKALAGKE